MSSPGTLQNFQYEFENLRSEIEIYEARLNIKCNNGTEGGATNQMDEKGAALQEAKRLLLKAEKALRPSIWTLGRTPRNRDLFVWQSLYKIEHQFILLMDFDDLKGCWSVIERKLVKEIAQEKREAAKSGEMAGSNTSPNKASAEHKENEREALNTLIKNADALKNDPTKDDEYKGSIEEIRSKLRVLAQRTNDNTIVELWNSYVISYNTRNYSRWAGFAAAVFLLVLLFEQPELFGKFSIAATHVQNSLAVDVERLENSTKPLTTSNNKLLADPARPEAPVATTNTAISDIPAGNLDQDSANTTETPISETPPSGDFVDSKNQLTGTQENTTADGPTEETAANDSDGNKNNKLEFVLTTLAPADTSIILAILAGLFGGAISAVSRPRLQPEETPGFSFPSVDVSYIRPLLGAASGLVLFLVSTTSGIDIAPTLFYVLAIGGGFSEKTLYTQLQQSSQKAQEIVNQAVR